MVPNGFKVPFLQKITDVFVNLNDWVKVLVYHVASGKDADEVTVSHLGSNTAFTQHGRCLGRDQTDGQ